MPSVSRHGVPSPCTMSGGQEFEPPSQRSVRSQSPVAVRHAGGGAALDGRRLEHVGGAVVAGAVAVLGDIAVTGSGTADRSALHVRGAGRTRAGAVLRRIADAGGGAALGRGRLEAVGGTVVAGAIAALGDVAHVGSGA